MTTPITEHQRQALLALVNAEAARVGNERKSRLTARHKLFAMIRHRYGCKYSIIPQQHFREAAHWLIDGPLE